ncbi:Hypothetical predicted protein [Marmota monax]|uniref:Immunoglobulin V-set domain-containing protein n=1 Tax=Marmota monax TaxID=9995 RepID=A0A5E4B7U4_MARMO|nr:Hypothetical predicted protein [Marmota monax]
MHRGKICPPRPSDSPPPPALIRAGPRGGCGDSAALRRVPESRESAQRGRGRAVFHHGEPSCRLPHGKMLHRPVSPGMGVHVGTALGVLCFCLTGAVEVQVPEDPVVALVGTDATLHCSFSPEPGFSLAQLNLIWQLTDTKQLVHSFAEGRDQGSAYANRTYEKGLDDRVPLRRDSDVPHAHRLLPSKWTKHS